MNSQLLETVVGDIQRRFDAYLKKALTSSAEHGEFGMPLLDALHAELPATACENCGVCCNSISIFSLEYHRVIRDLLTRLAPVKIRDLFQKILGFDRRFAEVGPELRLRCSFRDEATRTCLIHPVRPFACRLFGMRKDDGTRDCDKVRDLGGPNRFSGKELEQIQARIMANSEAFVVYPGQPEIAFFPFEFWVFRYTLGVDKALDIYREILVPASTPLSRLWKTQKAEKL